MILYRYTNAEKAQKDKKKKNTASKEADEFMCRKKYRRPSSAELS